MYQHFQIEKAALKEYLTSNSDDEEALARLKKELQRLDTRLDLQKIADKLHPIV